MKNLEFPIIGAKVKGLTKTFDVNSPAGRKAYFEAKVPSEIAKIKKYLEGGNTFVAYMLGKKNAGKGTYTKIISEIFGGDKIAHISVGDLIREIDDWDSFAKTEAHKKMKKYYRGFMSWDEAVNAHLGRSQSKLLPDEFILALLKAHIDELKGKCLFIDGLPRNLDQVSYSLFFRDLINYRQDPDMFVLIDIPESVIDARMSTRVVCSICHTPRTKKLFVTSKIEYDEKEKEFYLICDNPDCSGNGKERLVAKQGDDAGLESIRERLNNDEELIKKAFELHGVPKILMRNHVPVSEVSKNFDDYEITPEYVLTWNTDKKEVVVTEKPWTIKDDNGVECNSLLASPVVVSFIKQLSEVLEV